MFKKLLPLLMFSTATSVLHSQLVPPTSSIDTSLIAFASDTQAPMWVETLWLKSHNNRTATKNLFKDISNRKPGSLFILGDVVNLGYSNRQWKPIDKYLNDLRKEQIEVHAILGNHEVMGRAKRGEKKFQQRFPSHVRTGFLQIKDSVAIILLNSNFKRLSPQEDEAQTTWYKKTLATLDADPSIKFIISTCHHSPFTNSKVVGPSTDVQKRFVTPFLRSTKSSLFLTGHSHNFEHFKVEGKNFLVIGGGGGLTQPLRSGEGRRDDHATDYKPPFHYLTVRRVHDQLEVTSYKLTTDFKSFEKGLQLHIAPASVDNPVADKMELAFSEN